MDEVAFFAGAIGALGGAIAVIALRNPFYSVLALIVHLVSLAGLFLLLHARVRRRRPGRRLRRRGDRPLPLRLRLRRRRRGADLGADPGPAAARRRCSPRRSSSSSRSRSSARGLTALGERGRRRPAGLRHAGGDRRAHARAVPDRLRGRLAAAARRARSARSSWPAAGGAARRRPRRPDGHLTGTSSSRRCSSRSAPPAC